MSTFRDHYYNQGCELNVGTKNHENHLKYQKMHLKFKIEKRKNISNCIEYKIISYFIF